MRVLDLLRRNVRQRGIHRRRSGYGAGMSPPRSRMSPARHPWAAGLGVLATGLTVAARAGLEPTSQVFGAFVGTDAVRTPRVGA